MTQKDHNSDAILFQRAQEEALEELERREARLRFARNVRTLWAERVFLFRVSLAGLVLGVALALLIASRYTSSVRLMPPDNQSSSSMAMAAAALTGKEGATTSLGEMAGELLGVKNTSDMFVGILTSRTALDGVINRFDLRKKYGVRRMQDARRKLARQTDISVDRKSQIVTIAVTDNNPKQAAEMAQTYVDELNTLVATLSTSSARRERIFLEDRLKSVSQDLETAEKEFSRFSSKNSAIDIKEQGKAMVEAAATLQGRLIFAQSELEGLRQIYSDSNVRVRAVKARIEELQHQLEKFGGKGEISLGPDTQAADLYPSIRKLPLLGVEYADLYRRTKVQEAIYQALTQEYEMAKVQEAKDIPTVKVLDLPDVPETKSFPPRTLIALAGMTIALCGGVFFLLGSRSWSERDPDDVGKVLAQEIWIDLKEKRLLHTGESSENGTNLNGDQKHGILAFLGLRNGTGGSHINDKGASEQDDVEHKAS